MNNKNPEIKLILHHNYLQINCDDTKIKLPIRATKIIHDMYEARQAENEKKDIVHYTNDSNNYSYDVSVLIMKLKYSNMLMWLTKKIEPLDLRDK